MSGMAGPAADADAADADAVAGRHRRRSIAPPAEVRAGLGYCLKVFLTVRLGLSLVAAAAAATLPNAASLPAAVRARAGIPGPVGVPGWPAHGITQGWGLLLTSWERFDALWFLRIAVHGYANGDGSAAFFPLYPLTIRWTSAALGGHPLGAALLVSNLAFLLVLVVLYLLTRSELDDATARRAVLYAAVFPTALFFLAPYSESLFLLLALVSLWAARRERWWAAGLAGALAALTRSIGLVLVLPLAIEAVQRWRETRRPRIGALAWSAVPALGTLAYLLFWRHLSGDWLAPLHQQSGWQRHPELPWVTLWHATLDAVRYVGIYAGGYHELDWLISVPALVAGGYAAVKLRPLYGAYTWASFIVPLSFVFDGRPLMSFPRFVLPVFPVFWAMALWTRDRPARHQLVVALSGVLLGVLTLLFVNWYYVF